MTTPRPKNQSPLAMTVEYIDPEEQAYLAMYAQSMQWLAGWLPNVPQCMDMYSSIGTLTIQPPSPDAEDQYERDCERIRWVASTLNELLVAGGRIISIGYWKSDSRAPELTISVGVGHVQMRYRHTDIFSVQLYHSFKVNDLVEMCDAGDQLALSLEDKLISAEEALSYTWADLVARAKDFVPDNADV